MKHTYHFRYTFIMAAVVHAARVAHGPSGRRDAAIYFVKTLAADLQRNAQYDLAWEARALLRQLESYTSVFAVALLYGATESDLNALLKPAQPPASNTGVNSRQLNLLEDYVSNA